MKKYFILAAAAAMFAACSNNDDAAQNEITTERIPLALGYSFESLSATSTMRGNTVNDQDQKIDATNNTLGLFIFKADGTSVTDASFEKFNISSTALGDDNPATNYVGITSLSENIYYPDNQSTELDIYAYAPFVNATATTASYVPATFNDISSHKITFITKDDQTALADIIASDVLWGVQGKANPSGSTKISANQYKTAKTAAGSAASDGMLTGDNAAYYGVKSPAAALVTIPMKHLGSKIIVNLTTTGMDAAKLKNAHVKLHVDNVEGELDIKAGTLTASDTPSDNTILMTSHLGRNDADDNDEGAITNGYQCSAVIIPQTNTTVAANKIIEIDLKSARDAKGVTTNTTATYVYKNTTPQTYDSGKVYTYNIKVTASGLVVTTTVTNWDPVTAESDGSATLQ